MTRRSLLPPPLPLNKPCDLNGDAEALGPYTTRIDATPGALEGQHPIRRWEYAMVLYAIDCWLLKRAESPATATDALSPPPRIADIGGAGSNFSQLLLPLVGEGPILLLDPAAPDRAWRDGEPLQYWRETVEQFASHASHDQFDVLTCISVIEHVKDLRPFFRACRMLLKPGGLLILTTDYWDAEGEDVAHFHWMRERIYNAERMGKLRQSLGELGLKLFGGSDWGYPGPMVYDYSVASLAVVKV